MPWMTLLPAQVGQRDVTTLPLAPQRSHGCCICDTKPGPIWAVTIVKPWPLHAGHFFTSFSLLAPDPRHLVHTIVLLLSN